MQSFKKMPWKNKDVSVNDGRTVLFVSHIWGRYEDFAIQQCFLKMVPLKLLEK
jgi:hypothetical protein